MQVTSSCRWCLRRAGADRRTRKSRDDPSCVAPSMAPAFASCKGRHGRAGDRLAFSGSLPAGDRSRAGALLQGFQLNGRRHPASMPGRQHTRQRSREAISGLRRQDTAANIGEGDGPHGEPPQTPSLPATLGFLRCKKVAGSRLYSRHPWRSPFGPASLFGRAPARHVAGMTSKGSLSEPVTLRATLPRQKIPTARRKHARTRAALLRGRHKRPASGTHPVCPMASAAAACAPSSGRPH